MAEDGGGCTPLISVVLPVFNGGKFLVESIESILRQTFNDFELIILDDGSTDMTPDILREYQARDARITLVTQRNLGLAATLNEGIRLARGKWIARMDSDDIALPQRFEKQMVQIDQTDSDICGCWAKPFGSTNVQIQKHPSTDQAIKMALLFGSPFVHPTVIMRRELAKQLCYDNAWDKAEDYDLWERAARAGWKMTNVPELLLLYRLHALQVSSESALQQHILTQKIRRRYWYFVFDSLGISRDPVDEVLKIRESSFDNLNVDQVDYAFEELLRRHHGDAQSTIFDHATRLYFRIAADCPDIVARWGKLHKRYGSGRGLGTRLELWLLRLFRVRPSSDLFYYIKMIYFYLVRL